MNPNRASLLAGLLAALIALLGAAAWPGHVLAAAPGGAALGVALGFALHRWGLAFGVLWFLGAALAAPWCPMLMIPPMLAICSCWPTDRPLSVVSVIMATTVATVALALMDLEWALVTCAAATAALIGRKAIPGAVALTSVAGARIAWLALAQYLEAGRIGCLLSRPTQMWRRIAAAGWYGDGCEALTESSAAASAIAGWGGWLSLIAYGILLACLLTILVVLACRSDVSQGRSLAAATATLLIAHTLIHLQLLGPWVLFHLPGLPMVGPPSEVLAEAACLGMLFALTVIPARSSFQRGP